MCLSTQGVEEETCDDASVAPGGAQTNRTVDLPSDCPQWSKLVGFVRKVRLHEEPKGGQQCSACLGSKVERERAGWALLPTFSLNMGTHCQCPAAVQQLAPSKGRVGCGE